MNMDRISEAEPSASAPLADPELRQRIADYLFDKPGVAMPFSRRLAQENGWRQDFALRVIEEYRRFVYLVCIAGQELTPSDEVDQVWHLHLAYTRAYWEDFCPNVLRRPFHHGPTEGGIAENRRYSGNYQRTLALYAEQFGEAPPEDIWPPAEIRFGPATSHVRANLALFALVPKPPVSTSPRERPASYWVMSAIMAFGLIYLLAYILQPQAQKSTYFVVAAIGTVIYLVMRGIMDGGHAVPETRPARNITQQLHGHNVTYGIGLDGIVVASAITSFAATGGGAFDGMANGALANAALGDDAVSAVGDSGGDGDGDGGGGDGGGCGGGCGGCGGGCGGG